MNMNGAEFVRRAKRYARNTGLEFRFDRSEGKATFVKRSEIGRGLLAAMLKELGISKEEF